MRSNRPAWEEVTIGACRLIRGDAMEVLPALGESKVGIIIADPPFSVPVKYHDTDGDYPRSWGDLAIMEPYFVPLFTAMRKVCRSDGQVYICCDATTYPVFYKATMPLWPRSHLLVWYKPTGRRGTGWKHSHELVLHLATARTVYQEDFRQDVIGIMPVRTLERRHPAQKPGELMEFLLEASLPHLAPVLDTHMGSGSTALACIKKGYDFIGIELEPYYFDIACKRIEAAYAQPDLFIPSPLVPPTQLALEVAHGVD